MNEQQLRKLRPPRIVPLATQSHDDNHGWAVSYADFLMVLLSFFILFFSIDGNKRAELINQMKDGGGEKKSGTGATRGADGAGAAAISKGAQSSQGVQAATAGLKGIDGIVHVTTSASLSPIDNTSAKRLVIPVALSEELLKLEGFIVENGEKSRRLSIHFEDNIYRPGQVELPKEQIPKLLAILERLRAFQAEINITFEGHTDPSLLSKSKTRYLTDNFALSSLRATNALQTAVAAGMDPSYMFAKGGAENSRSSRSLSIIVSPREVEQ